MVDYVDVYETGGTTVQVEVNGETTLTTTEGQTVQVETIAGIKGETGQSGFVVEANGTYPARPPGALAVTFVGADNPDTLGLMQVGDTWINTAGTNNTGPGYVKGNTTAPVLKTNLVTNPSAESAGGWFSNNGNVYPVTRDTSTKHSGTQAVKSTVATSGATASLLSIYGAGGTSNAKIPCNPGDKMTISCYVKASRSNCLGYTYFNWYDSSGTFITSSKITKMPLNSTGWTRIYSTDLVPSNATSYFAMIVVEMGSGMGTSSAGDMAWADDLQVELGNLSTFFSGDTAGCQWTGTPNQSTSQKLLELPNESFSEQFGNATSGTLLLGDSTQTSGWKFSSSLYLEGSGFPTMDAPVGTMYIDTAATNGAIRWIKTKAGSGNGNWQVEYGDTGWRNIDPLLDTTVVTTNNAHFFLRRVRETIYFVAGDFYASSSNTMFIQPVGFRVAGRTGYATFSGGAGNSGSDMFDIRFAPSYNATPYAVFMELYFRQAITTAKRGNWNLQYVTDDSWPSSLPGTAG